MCYWKREEKLKSVEKGKGPHGKGGSGPLYDISES